MTETRLRLKPTKSKAPENSPGFFPFLNFLAGVRSVRIRIVKLSWLNSATCIPARDSLRQAGRFAYILPKGRGIKASVRRSPGNAVARCSATADEVGHHLLARAVNYIRGLHMADKKVVVAGATGLVGTAALRPFGSSGEGEVAALSRRQRVDLYGARHVEMDLTDAAQCARSATQLQGATHLIYAALYEAPNLVDGWRDERQIRTNDLMLRNLMAVLEPAAPSLKHVALLQGTKAYGVHVRPLTVPAREGRSEMYEQPNFYCAQENFLRELQRGKDWHWSILRP